MSLRLLQKPETTTLATGRVHCCECDQLSACSQSTRVFVHYCGSMTAIMKEQISRAQTECRRLRRSTRLFARPAQFAREQEIMCLASH
jgi:hypothetical protein